MNNRIDVLVVGDRSVGYYPVRGIDGKREKMTVIMVLHDINHARMYADDIVILKDKHGKKRAVKV